MAPRKPAALAELLKKHEEELLADWLQELGATGIRGATPGRDGLMDQRCREFLSLLQAAVQAGGIAELDGPAWAAVREFLVEFSRFRVREGYTPSQTAIFIFSLKQPLFSRMRTQMGQQSEALLDELWTVTELLDRLGLQTVEAYQHSREEIISRQQQEMLELSTPVVSLWDGILALPMIGTLDSARTQVVMETLLERIVETRASIAIIDITGVPTVDTLVAQHLLKTVTAARLMGADCIISGIRPQIAQTIVHLGVELRDVVTKASLADAFALALQRTGSAVRKNSL